MKRRAFSSSVGSRPRQSSLGVNEEEIGYNVCGGAGDASISNELTFAQKDFIRARARITFN